MRNIFTIDADIKLKMLINEPTVVQNDDIRFIINVFDNGQPLDLTNVETVSLANVRLDGQTIVTPGTKIDTNIVQFDLGTEETKVPGRVEATAQFYDSEGRVSTISFSYRVVKDPTGDGYIPTEREQTLIETVLGDGPLIIQQAQDAANFANEQGQFAQTQANAASEAAMSANEAAQSATNAANEANTAAQSANTAAQSANDAATSANTAAQNANQAAANANNAATNANTKATYAQQQGDYAKAQGDYAKQVGDENKTRWLTAVNTYADIATTYPNPQLGDTVQTIDDSKIYRWDGTQWVWTQQYNANAITDVQNKIGILKQKVENFTYIPELTVGLNVYFSKGSMATANGDFLTFDGGAITVQDNTTSYIMFDLFEKVLHAFPRAIHRGAVHIATVTASNGQIIDVKQPNHFEIPKSRIGKTKRFLQNPHQTIRVAIIGDSLLEGAGSGVFWTKLLFDSAQNSYGYNVSNLTSIRVNYFAVGSQTSHFGLVQLGRAVTSNGASGSNGGKLPNTAITWGPYYGSRYFTPSTLKESALRTGQYDLAIIGFGANGGTYSLGYLENIVKILRSRGTEVIIVTENNRTDNPDFLKEEGLVMARIADVWGCELADTWSYVKEMQNNGISTHNDVIHMNQDGHFAWAKAVRSILNDIEQERETIDLGNAVRVVTYPNASLSKKFQSVAEVQFTPFEHTGTVKAGNVTDTFKNVAIHYGGKTASDYIIELAAGQYAWFAHAHAHAVDFLYDYNSVFTAEIRDNNDNVLGTISGGVAGLDRVGLVEGISSGVYGSISAGNPGYNNRGIKVVCTSGVMRLIGAVFYTWENEELPLDKIEYIGTWNEEAWIYQQPVSKYTDTVGDSFVFEFVGTGCQLLLSSRTASGIIDVYLDGEKIYSNIDLYNTGNYVYSLNIFPYRTNDYFNRGYGKHVVKVVLTGVNASASAPATSNRRLQLLAGYIFDGR